MTSAAPSNAGVAGHPVVLFDLDDTLFDHQFCSRTALRSIQQKYPELLGVRFEGLENRYQELLETWHQKFLEGHIDLEESRLRRWAILLSENIPCEIPDEWAAEAADAFMRAYQDAYRPVPGALDLLNQLAANNCRVGIVTNHTLLEQTTKLDRIGIARYVETLVVPEAIGFSKPDPRIFEAALTELGGTPERSVMIGDSWTSDIMGARKLGLHAIWLNRYGHTCPEPNSASEVTSLEPVDRVLGLILEKLTCG